MPTSQQLVTLRRYWNLPAVTQGYIVYMQAEIPGSELKGQTNPYPVGSHKYRCWNGGQQRAVEEVQDLDD